MTAIKFIISGSFLVLNTLVCGLAIHYYIVLQFLSRLFGKSSSALKKFQDRIRARMVIISERWITWNSWAFKKFLRFRPRTQVPEGLAEKDSYIVVSNHRSWTDILVLQMVFNHRIPFLRFFIKDTLKWVPVLGPVWKALDYPFMKRKGGASGNARDLETARMSCETLKGKPVSVLIFLEGTRFTFDKWRKQKSPFKNLLKPKIGGLGITIDSLGSQIKSIVDVTIVYPKRKLPFGLTSFLSGKVSDVRVQIKEIPIPEIFRNGHLSDDRRLRQQFEVWINQIWAEKDEFIASHQMS